MFSVARFPFGRTIGKFFYRDQSLTLTETSCPKNDDVNHPTSVFDELDIDLAVKSIEKQGYYLGLQLPPNIVQEILEFAYSADIYVDGNPRFKFKYAEKEQAAQEYNLNILIGNYLDANSKCAALPKLGSDSKLNAIAAKYLGNKPVLVRSQLAWNFIGNKEDYAQKGEIGNPSILFHYDLDDYRALKFFFYLTDVDSLSGSHRCVAGSHNKRKLMYCLLRSQSDQKIANYYGSDNIIDICGPAGYGFAEDPFCFHRGSPPVTSPRLMIQLEFALNDYGMWDLSRHCSDVKSLIDP
ncbi:MAG: hypothetical protein ACFCU7_19565 [Pleurocapsa sp.]